MKVEFTREYSMKRNTHTDASCSYCKKTLGFTAYFNEEYKGYEEPYCSSDCLQTEWVLFQKKIKDQLKD